MRVKRLQVYRHHVFGLGILITSRRGISMSAINADGVSLNDERLDMSDEDSEDDKLFFE